MVLPCQETFGPWRLHWELRVATTAFADFCSHAAGHPAGPAFQAKPYSRVRLQISPNKGRELSLHKCVVYRGVCRIRLRSQRSTRHRVSLGLYDVSVRHLAALA